MEVAAKLHETKCTASVIELSFCILVTIKENKKVTLQASLTTLIPNRIIPISVYF